MSMVTIEDMVCTLLGTGVFGAGISTELDAIERLATALIVGICPVVGMLVCGSDSAASTWRGVHLPVQDDLLKAPLCEPGLGKLPHECLLPGHDVVDRLLRILLCDVLAQRWESSRTNKQQDTNLAHVVEEHLT